MKLLKLIPLLLLFLTFSTNVYAEENCDEIKGNIVGKMLCKATSGSGSTMDGTEKRGILSKIGWKRPEWTKRKKN